MQTEQKIGWMTTETKDGKTKLDKPFYATNPRYIEVHNTWKWQEVPYDLAVAEMISHQLAGEWVGEMETKEES